MASRERLDELIEEATVDAYGPAEQAVGWLTMIEEHVGFPFVTEVLGIDAEVVGVDLTEMDEILAVCRRGNHSQRILLSELPLPSSPPAGAERIEAYRVWSRGPR